MIRFEEIIEKVLRNYPEADPAPLRRAYLFSAREHRGQMRKSGEPYLLHPLEVANILADLRLDPECIIAGLLHDVVEDTCVPIKSIEESFGAEIADMVEGLTKIAKLDHISYEERQALNMRKLLLAVADDVRVVLVKLADRLHNMRTLQYLDADKRHLIARETLDVYAPLAHILGLSHMRNEMGELAFKFLDPHNYRELNTLIESRRPRLEAFLERITLQVEKIMSDARIRVINIEQHIKRLYPLYQRLQLHQATLDQIHDLVVIIVITESVKDCYGALGVIHATWRPVPNTLQDLIALPRENFYQAINTSVLCEGGQLLDVQICTEEMNRIANEGIISNWKHKTGPRDIHYEDKAFARLRQVTEWQDEVKSPQEFLDTLKLDLSQKKIHCITPKGKAVELPRGATPIDFAFAIHTQLGLRCAGAKANGGIVPLKYEICDGDLIEIISSPAVHPSRDWMNFIKTTRARLSLRRYFIQSERSSAINLGGRLLEKEAINSGFDPTTLLPGSALERAAPQHGFTRAEHLLSAIGYGKVLASSVIRTILSPDQAAQIKEPNRSKRHKTSDQISNFQVLIRVKGCGELEVHCARCCNPIRGEPIMGYIKRGKGLIIHSTDCAYAPGLRVNPDRIVEVEWARENAKESAIYQITLRLMIENRLGMVVDVARAIATVDTNLRDLHSMVDNQGRTNLLVTAEIIDFQHLEKLMRAIKAVNGVLDLTRMNQREIGTNDPGKNDRPASGIFEGGHQS